MTAIRCYLPISAQPEGLADEWVGRGGNSSLRWSMPLPLCNSPFGSPFFVKALRHDGAEVDEHVGAEAASSSPARTKSTPAGQADDLRVAEDLPERHQRTGLRGARVALCRAHRVVAVERGRRCCQGQRKRRPLLPLRRSMAFSLGHPFPCGLTKLGLWTRSGTRSAVMPVRPAAQYPLSLGPCLMGRSAIVGATVLQQPEAL